MKLGSYLKKSISTGLGNSVGSALISIVFIPLIIKRIGFEIYGIWAILFIFIGISSVADLGLSKSLVYFIPKQKSQKEIDEVYSAGFFLNTFIILLVVIAGLIFYWSGVNVWGNNEIISYKLGHQLFLCGVIITCFSLATGFLRSILEALYKIYLVNIGFLLLTILNYTSTYILSLFTNKVEYLIFNTTAVYVIIFFFHAVVVRLSTTSSLHFPSISTIKRIFKYTFGFFSIGIINSIMPPVNRYLIILLAGDIKAYGIFDVAMKISSMALGCLQAFTIPLFSVFSGYGKAKIVEIKRILNHYFIGLIGCYILGCILFFITGKSIIEIFTEKGESISLFNASLILILGCTLYGVAEPFVRALFALGNMKLSFNIKVVQLIINILLIVLFTNLYPLYRFSLAFSLSYAITAILYIVSFKKKYSDDI